MSTTIIAGGGIGGLATALSLARHEQRVQVLERRDAFAEIGAGIQLAPNAFRCLDLLGVGPAVRADAVFIDELRFMDGTSGRKVAAMALTEDYRSRFGGPYAVIARSDLYQALLRGCQAHPSIDLLTGQHVVGYQNSPGAVSALTAAGDRFVGTALIGADGLRSRVRAQLAADGRPRISGHSIYRSTIAMDDVPVRLRSNSVTLWAGPKWHFVHYPIGAGRYLNLAATRDDGAEHEVSGDPVSREHVLAQFPGLGHAAGDLLALGRDWRTWVLCDRDPIHTWTDGRVALLGDAAHPMLQYAAQGACMALEDAVVIGRHLSASKGGAPDEDIPARLQAYADERRTRTARTQLVSREMGRQLYHPAGAAAGQRNAMLSALSTSQLHDRVAWLHAGPAADVQTDGPTSVPAGAPVDVPADASDDFSGDLRARPAA